MREETINCPMKVVELFPYGKVLVPDMVKLKKMLSHKKRLEKFKHIKTIKVPTTIKIQKKDGSIIELKARKIIKKPSSKNGKVTK